MLGLFLRRPDTSYDTKMILTGDFLEKIIGGGASQTFSFSESDLTSDEVLPLTEVKFSGYDQMKVHTNLCNNYIESNNTPGLQRSNLLALVPTPSLPGGVEYFIHPGLSERILVDNLTLDTIRVAMYNNGKLMEDFNDFTLVISIEFIEKDTMQPAPSMALGRAFY